MGKIKEFIKTNPSLRLIYRILKYGKDKCYGSFHSKQVYRKSKRKLYKQVHPTKTFLIKEASSSLSLPKQPIFTVVVSVSAITGRLSSLVKSLQAQTYTKWELFFFSISHNPSIWASLQELASLDSRIQILASDGTKASADGYDRDNRSLQALLAKATGSHVALLDENSSLHPSALFEVASALNGCGADFLYTDSCLVEDNCYTPLYKPDYAPDTLRSLNYIGGFAVVAETLLASLDDSWRCANLNDLWFRCTEKAFSIHHIPEVLHYCYPEKLVDSKSDTSSLQVVRDHLQRKGWGVASSVSGSSFPSSQVLHLTYEIIGNPLVSIIIPNKDHISELQPCIESIVNVSTYRNFEIVIVENNSTEQETFSYYDMLKKTFTNIHVVVWEGTFNYAAINNFGVGHCQGEHLLFLNNDTTIITPSWMEEMLMFSQRDDVGLVGCMLYYPDDTIQHAGLVVGLDAGSQSYAEHLYRGVRRGSPGYCSALRSVRNVSALTGACLMTSRKAFALCNGFDEEFAVQFNDIDLCLKALSLGLLNIFTPYAQLYHFESKSRPLDDSSARQLARYYQARDAFYAKWELMLDKHDPYHNKNLDIRLEKYTFVFR